VKAFILPLALALSTSIFMAGCSDKTEVTKANTKTETTEASKMAELVKTDVKVGDGVEAVAGKMVAVHYTGWLYDEKAADKHGTKFDSSRDRGEAFQFPLAADALSKAGIKVYKA
jgi:FKBP-type peptidyl-prolyl cis-trans isomerase